MVRGAKAFSVADVQSAYWQIPVHPDHVQATAFVINSGEYCFKRTPFGVCSASSCCHVDGGVNPHGISGSAVTVGVLVSICPATSCCIKVMKYPLTQQCDVLESNVISEFVIT